MAFTKMFAAASLIASLVLSSVSNATTVPTIKTVGNKFYTSTGTQFYVKGIAYQLTENDPLIDTEQCTLDAALMKTLGANAIRVYHVDPTASHDGCMTAFANNGIYLFLDLDTFTTAIDPSGAVWTTSQYEAFAAVMDAFHSYNNTLGFFVGNEVIAMANQSNAAPYIKAAARDMKAYRDSKGYRSIPVGYSAADIAELRPMLQNYLACGGNSSESIDFFGLNAYEWCGSSSYTVSGYDTLTEEATGYSVPIFFSETGCNTPAPRTFQDQSAIFGSEMNSIWSGAIIYEWIEEANNYGLISYGPTVAATATGTNIAGGYSRAGTPTPISPDFTNLQSQWSTLTPTGTPSSDYTPTITTPACPTSTASGWLVNGNVALPTLNEALASVATTTVASATTSGTQSAASATSSSKGGASGRNELTGMGIGLVGVMLGFVYWL